MFSNYRTFPWTLRPYLLESYMVNLTWTRMNGRMACCPVSCDRHAQVRPVFIVSPTSCKTSVALFSYFGIATLIFICMLRISAATVITSFLVCALQSIVNRFGSNLIFTLVMMMSQLPGYLALGHRLECLFVCNYLAPTIFAYLLIWIHSRWEARGKVAGVWWPRGYAVDREHELRHGWQQDPHPDQRRTYLHARAGKLTCSTGRAMMQWCMKGMTL